VLLRLADPITTAPVFRALAQDGAAGLELTPEGIVVRVARLRPEDIVARLVEMLQAIAHPEKRQRAGVP
jgi:hypothetical protein